MALLDFSRFGVTAQDVRDGKYSYIIGFDLGDGEISAAYWNLKEEGFVKPYDLKFDKDEHQKVLSALFAEKNGTIHIGTLSEMSNLASTQGNLYINFKVSPKRLYDSELYEGDSISKKQLMQLVLRKCLEKIYESNSNRFDGEGLLVIGCPSGPEWLENGSDLMYADILKEGLEGLDMRLKVIVMPESRASLIKVYKEQGQLVGSHVQDGVVVMDHGSSTFDITLINFITNQQADDSIPLGANKIERTMLKVLLEQNKKNRFDLLDFRSQLLLIRNAKEAFFTNPVSKPRIFIEWTDGDCAMSRVSEEFMTGITHQSPQSYTSEKHSSAKGSWVELHKDFTEKTVGRLCRTMEVKPAEFNGVILLTGGASKMQFIRSCVDELFPKAHIVIDPEPSYCVSRGLAWAAYTDLKALELISTVKERIGEAIRADFRVLKAIIADNLSPIVYEYALTRLKDWVKNGDNVTLTEFVKDVESSFLDSSTSEGSQRIKLIEKTIRGSITEYLNNNDDTGVRALIVNTVNDVFSATFPGKIRTQNITPFEIKDNEWANVVSEVSSNQIKFRNSLLQAINLENVLMGVFKCILALCILTGAVILKILTFGMVDIDTVCKYLDKMFVENQTLSKERRQKALNKFKENKEENVSKISEAIRRARMSAEARDNVSSQIIQTLSPVIDKAVDVVSIYF
ncbi:MAG: hypothetical protein K2N96_06675 [Muribaculaceae bacterium]|nr:hypothetical protein [Muribaculaceae bacterium]